MKVFPLLHNRKLYLDSNAEETGKVRSKSLK